MSAEYERITGELRATARRLLQSGDASMLIGYAAGTLPGRVRPTFIQSPEQADQLIWNDACTLNLTRYLPELKDIGTLAVVVKGCDIKAAVGLLQEHQIEREQVKLIGIECYGVRNPDGSVPAKCESCDVHKPSLSDELITATGTPPTGPGVDALVSQIEGMSIQDRAAYWEERFADCLRCYACRQVCPLCYCKECFTDKSRIRWLSKSVDPGENWMFHLTRAMHLAGRCIGCAECERACPMNLPLTALGARLAREVEALFGFVPGRDPEEVPVLARFSMDDPELEAGK